MVDTTNWRILQIIPADGYAAERVDENGHTHRDRLCAWALVEDVGENRRFVTGLVPESDIDGECSFAADEAGFRGFTYDPAPL